MKRECVRVSLWAMMALPWVLMLALGLTPGISMQEDLGRHLLLGRIILEQGGVPATNLLTSTYSNFPFINHHWLSEVLLYEMHRWVGLNGLIGWKALMLAGALGLALRTGWVRRISAVYLWAGLLAAVMMGFRSHIRPELFTYLGIALFGWCFERIRFGLRWPWLVLLAYGWFWANAHIYSIFGGGMVGAFILERWWMRWREGIAGIRQFPWVEAVAGVGVALVGLISPHGWAGWLYPFRIFGNYGVAITENASPLELWHSVLNPMLLALPMLSVLALVALMRVTILRPRMSTEPLRLANYLILVAGLISAWSMARSAPLLALVALPVVGEWRRIVQSRTLVTWPCVWGGAAVGVWLLWGVVNGWYMRVFPSPIGPTPFGFEREERYLALAKLTQDGLPLPVFSDYNIGSLVEYNLYPAKGYVDNRPEAFPEEFWRNEYELALQLGSEWERICEVRDIQTVIVSPSGVREGYVRAMMNHPAWRLVHLDAIALVWVRAGNPAYAAFREAHALDEAAVGREVARIAELVEALPSASIWRRQVMADEAIYSIYSLLCIGVIEPTWPTLWTLHERYPDYQVVHELLRVMAPPEAVEGVKSVMARRAQWPLAAKQVMDWARVLEQEGNLDQARQVVRHGRWFFPLSDDLREMAQRLGA